MGKNLKVGTGKPLLDIASYARRGPNSERLTPSQVEHIRLTVRRVPEVVVKVLPRGSNDFKAVGKHLDYIGRYGELELESDDGELLQGRVGKALLEDWDLDIDEVRPQAGLAGAKGIKAPKLVHKLMFSMPPGTPSDKVLQAVRNFAREQFALQHRYAFVLHTDEPHPHVHLVLKALDEQGARLNIRKATLRVWRSEFARHLRILGVAANATERAVRGQTRSPRKDAIYRANLRGESQFENRREVAAKSARKHGPEDIESLALADTRRLVLEGWSELANGFMFAGDQLMAQEVKNFLFSMPTPLTDQQRAMERIDKGQSRTRSADCSSLTRD